MGVPISFAGWGLATALGADPAANWERASKGLSGTRLLEGFSFRGKPLPVGRCELDEVAAAGTGRVLDPRVPRVQALAEAVAAQALRGVEPIDPDRLGLYFGSSLTTTDYVGSLYARLYDEQRRAPPSALIEGMNCHPASEIASSLGITGPVCTVSTSCSSSLQALQIAVRDLRAGVVDAAVVIGADSSLSHPILEMWMGARVLSSLSPPETAARPFCATRQGMVYAEGAAAVVLRPADKARGGPRYLGGSVRHDPKGRLTTSREAISACLRAALADAGVAADRIDLVEAHAAGTQLDLAEAEALSEVVGRRAAIHAPKAHFGSPLGAAGLVNLVFALMALQHHRVPGNLNVFEKDPAIEALVDCYHGGRELPKSPTALVDCFGFGGTNASVVIGWEEEGE